MSGYKSYPGIIIKFTYTSRGRIYNHSIMDDVEVKYGNGQILISDSTSIFLRKILTPTNFVVIVEKRIPELNNKKNVTVASGGTYTLKDGNYQEFTKYAAFDGFEKMNINYKLTMKDGKLHTIGTIGGPEIYEELYERVDW